MLHTIQSNIVDRYRGGENHLTTPATRSVTVFAIGAPGEIAAPSTLERLRERANELLPGTPDVEASVVFDVGDVAVGEPFGVEIAQREPHRVRVVDGPLEDEAVLAFRVLGTHAWA